MTISEKIVKWVKNKVEEAGAKGVVIGISGGIDSSVTAVLCNKAVKTLGLIMPCHSDESDLECAKMVAKNFGIETQMIDLTPIYDQLIKTLPTGDVVAQGNLKSRLRMVTLYYFANNHDMLVVGTSNKSEIRIGYYTKYGDGGVDIEPIGDLLKTEVRKLAKELGVPKSVIERAPSAGLWAGQTDEEEIGMNYSQLDKIIQGIENDNLDMLEPRLIERVKEMFQKSEHKRKMPEICKIS